MPRTNRDAIADVDSEIDYLLRTEGLRAATEALISTCKDATAPAQARAAAGRTIFEATGRLKKEPPGPEKELPRAFSGRASGAIRDGEAKVGRLRRARRRG